MGGVGSKNLDFLQFSLLENIFSVIFPFIKCHDNYQHINDLKNDPYMGYYEDGN